MVQHASPNLLFLSHLFLSFTGSFCYGHDCAPNDTGISAIRSGFMRADNRAADELRPVTIEDGAQPHAAGSVLIRMGGTHVLCGVSIEDKVPPFLLGSGQGWITAEYGMLPCATHTRGRREAVSGVSGRTYEIQRLIGRSLRMMVDLRQLGEHTLRVDCDVLNADGGTRCASITGAALALRQALTRMAADGRLAAMPRLLPVAAVSVGAVGGIPLLDLAYSEDCAAEVDANFVMAADGRWIEMQCTAESSPFQPELFVRMQDLANRGIRQLLLQLWQE
jgi:ribonuclease PH